MKVKVFSTQDIESLNLESVTSGRNRCLSEDTILKLDPLGWHVEDYSFVHNDKEIRINLLCKVKDESRPLHVQLDCSFENYNNLGRVISLDENPVT